MIRYQEVVDYVREAFPEAGDDKIDAVSEWIHDQVLDAVYEIREGR